MNSASGIQTKSTRHLPDAKVNDEKYAEREVHLKSDGVFPVDTVLQIRKMVGI